MINYYFLEHLKTLWITEIFASDIIGSLRKILSHIKSNGMPMISQMLASIR